ncbi:MAG: EamA family transporter [Alphaproteobacteria bacterium]|nr:EamA family transporter [Alphaproteobacteria bacterium]
MDATKSTLIGTIALGMWATLALFTALSGDVPPFQLVAMAFTLGSLMALAKWLWRGERVLERLRQPVGAWALGVFGLFGYHFFYFLALRQAPALQANLLNYLWPLLIVLFSALLPGHRLLARHVMGGLMGLAGAVLLVGGGGAVAFEPAHALGYASAVVCAVIWAAYSVANRRYAHVPTDAVGGFCAATALLALICHLAFESTVVPRGGEWLAILGLGLGPVGAAFFAWDHGVKHGDVRALGILAYAVPLMSTGLLIAFGRAQADGTVAAACALIIGGALLGTGNVFRRQNPSSRH